jgi:hypothetical protein
VGAAQIVGAVQILCAAKIRVMGSDFLIVPVLKDLLILLNLRTSI